MYKYKNGQNQKNTVLFEELKKGKKKKKEKKSTYRIRTVL